MSSMWCYCNSSARFFIFSPNQRLQHHHHHFFIIICLISLAFSVPKYKSPHAKVFSLHSSVGTRIISSSSSHLISPLRSVRVGRRARTHIVALAKPHLTCVQLVREVLVLGSLVGGGISNRSSSFNCLLSLPSLLTGSSSSSVRSAFTSSSDVYATLPSESYIYNFCQSIHVNMADDAAGVQYSFALRCLPACLLTD